MIFTVFLYSLNSCATSMASANPKTVEEAEKARAKDLRKKKKLNDKAKKKAEKEYWKLQSKSAKKRVKKTKKRTKQQFR